MSFNFSAEISDPGDAIRALIQSETQQLRTQVADLQSRVQALETDDPSPTPSPEPTDPTTPPDEPTDTTTGGSGGSFTNRTNQSFTSNNITSAYHIYASGIDTSKKVGILVYGDGSGEYGLRNPSSTYLLSGTDGLINIAKKHNLILLTPLAPGNGCTDGDGTCWYSTSYDGTSPTQKNAWSFNLIKYIYSQYNIDLTRVVIAGYSSGAQWTSQFIIPAYGAQLMKKGLFVPISYGGAPRVSTTFTQEFKDNVVGSWDTGTADSAYSTASYGALGGYNWYKDNGFTVDATWPSGVGHSRSRQFGPILDREITQHLLPA